MMRYLYEYKIGKIDLDADKGLFDIYENVDVDVDVDLFERAINISTERNKPNITYIKGIIRKWNDNGIRTLDSLKVIEEKRSLRGDKDNEQRGCYGKSKSTNVYEDDGVIYQRPSEEFRNKRFSNFKYGVDS